jgi:hypothetical protein
MEVLEQINTVRVGYERLFNMGDYEHEKYTISKDVEAGNEYDAFKKLALDIVEFEADLAKYRILCSKIQSKSWAAKHEPIEKMREKAKQELEVMRQMITEFKEKHKPVYKACKCYYCTHIDDYDDKDDD